MLCGQRFTGVNAKSGLNSHLQTDHADLYDLAREDYQRGGKDVQSPADRYNAAEGGPR